MGAIRSPFKERKRELAINLPYNVTDLFNELQFGEDERKYIVLIVNNKTVSHSYEFQDGDSVFVTLAIGGG